MDDRAPQSSRQSFAGRERTVASAARRRNDARVMRSLLNPVPIPCRPAALAAIHPLAAQERLSPEQLVQLKKVGGLA